MTAAILFDFNGVIVDDEAQHCDALIATLAEYGCTLDRDRYYRNYLGFHDRDCCRFATSHGERDCTTADALWQDFTGHAPAELPWAHA